LYYQAFGRPISAKKLKDLEGIEEWYTRSISARDAIQQPKMKRSV
jgi:hypothetical protein